MTLVKICGITSLEDAKFAIAKGANALGFNFSKTSPRCLTASAAEAIVKELPKDVWLVGLFVNQAEQEVEQIVRSVALNTLQFHGDETPAYCKGWEGYRIIKAGRIRSEADIDALSIYMDSVEHCLIDSRVDGAWGGTGHEVEDELLRMAVRKGLVKNAILAGGLTAENVAQKIEAYQPFGVDVSSGVEKSPGVKDPVKVENFILNALKKASQNA